MHNSRKTIVLNCVCLFLVLLSGPVRFALRGHEQFSYNLLIYTFFAFAALIWAAQLQRRIVQPEIRKNLIAVAIFVILWMLLRTVKYVFTGDDSIAARYCWYLYYLPQTFILLPMFFSVLYIGRPAEQPISRRWRLLYLPAAVIVLAIVTNDFHQLAFRFPGGVPTEEDYSHGVFYFVSLAWMIVLFAAMLVVSIRRCAVYGNRKKIWMPLVPLLLGALCVVSFFIWPDTGILALYRVPEIVCVVYCVFMECLIVAGLLPSNDSYDELWNASSIGAGVMDRSGVIRYSAAQQTAVTPAQVLTATQEEILLEDGSSALRSQEISGGFGFWTKDISEISRLNHALAESGDVLAEENAMLDAENKLAQERVRVEQQNRLYDSIAKSVRPQLDRLGALLDALPQEEAAFAQTMKYACILNTYIKRRSNLQLLLHQQGSVESGELRLALGESVEYLRLYGVQAHAVFSGDGLLDGECVLLAYALFEEAIEASLPDANAVFVSLSVADGGLKLRMELNAPKNLLPRDTLHHEISAQGGTLEIVSEETTEYICLRLPEGGAEK
ncbi:MAG: histidine kinase N-terminal 7TM domain-containing protein [Faecousia sp.]